MGRFKGNGETLCWDCTNSSGWCSWSQSYKPVKGWHAVPTVISPTYKPIPSFCVLACPEFKPCRRGEQKGEQMKISFTVEGLPVGKGRPRFTQNGHTYTPNKTKAYEEYVRTSWRTQSGMTIAADTPVTAYIDGYFPIPKHLSKKRHAELSGTAYTKKCDADNLAKSILDALNGYAYDDDSRISRLIVTKTYSDNPRVEVMIEAEEEA